MTRSAPAQSSQVLLAVMSLVGLFACQSPVVISGEHLAPEERAEIRVKRGVKFVAFDGQAVGARWIVVTPGAYEVDILSQRDLKEVSPQMEGIIMELECKIRLSPRPGEELSLSSRMKRGKDKFSGGYSRYPFFTEISLESSLESDPTFIDTRGCTRSWDCSKVDRTRVRTKGCS